MPDQAPTQITVRPDQSLMNTIGPQTTPQLSLPPPADGSGPQFSLPPEGATELVPPPSPDEAYAKAVKWDFAMGPDSPGVDQIKSTLEAGLEADLRANAVASDALRENHARQQLVGAVLGDLQAKGQSLTSAGVDYLMQMGTTVRRDPTTIMEDLYAKRYVEHLVTSDNENNPQVYQQADAANPKQTTVDMDAAQMLVARQEISDDILQQAQKNYDNTKGLEFAWDMFKTFIPLHSWNTFAKLTDKLPGAKIWTGDGLMATIEGLYLLPPPEFKKQAQAIYDKLKDANPVDAMYFATRLKSYSAFQAGIDNLQTLLDAVAVTQMSKAAYSAGKALNMKLMAGIAANVGPKTTVADGLAAAGNTEASAVAKITDQMSSAQTGAKAAEEAVSAKMPGMTDPKNYLRSVGTLSNERARRLEDILKQSDALFEQIRTGLTTVPRIDDSDALKLAFTKAVVELAKTYPYLKDAVLDVVPERVSADTFGTVDKIRAYFGNIDATWFVNQTQAAAYAKNFYKLPEGVYEIVPYKGQWAIRLTKEIDETDPLVRDWRVATENRTPETWINAVLGWARTPEATLSLQHRTVRHVLTYASSMGEKLLHKALAPVRALSGNQYKRLAEIIEQNGNEYRKYVRPDGSTVKLPGNWYDDVGTYQAHYLLKYGHFPTDAETAAYFTIRRFYDFDFNMRNTLVRLSKARKGGEQKSLIWTDIGEDGNPVRVGSHWFDGRTVDKLPWDSAEPFTVGWVDKNGKFRFYLSSQMFKAQRDEVEALISSGAKIVQPFQDGQKTVQDLFKAKGEPVNYIVGKEFHTKPLAAEQVEWRAGPHAIYPTEGRYVKQEMLSRTGKGRTIYRGDRVMSYHQTEADAKRFADAVNEVFRMINLGMDRNNPAAFEAFLHQHTPWKSAADVRKFIKANGYRVDRPVHVVESGQRISDKIDLSQEHGVQVIDTAKSVHNPDQGWGVRFTQERDRPPFSLDNQGTEANPDWQFRPTKTIDVSKTLEIMGSDLMRSRFYSDYVTRAAEDWAQQFADLLDQPVERTIADPYSAIRNPKWKTTNLVDFDRLMAAKNSRRSIMYLIGEPTPAGRFMKWMRDGFLNEVDQRLGRKTANTIEPWLWTKTTDPVRMARTVSFMAKLGFFYPRQLYLQGYAVVHSYALTGNPLRSIQATLMSWYSSAAELGDFNPAYMKFLTSKTAQVLGLDEKTLTEYYTLLQKTGMTEVGGEVGKMDTIIGEKVFNRGPLSYVERANRKSSMFFRAGDRFTRRVGFATAFLEWRAANPTKKITGDILHQIEQRANMLTINQTRASNTPMLQRGIPSLFTQFAGYQGRLMEQMIGGQLTWKEKLRAMLTYSMIHGPIVGTAGLVIGGIFPVYETYRKHMLSSGADMNDPINKFLSEGGLSMLIEQVTGQPTNFNYSFGPGGNSFILDALGGDIWSLGGPSAKIVQSFLDRFDPFSAAIYGAMQTPNKLDTQFPIGVDDIIDATKDIGVVNNSLRAWYAWKYEKLINNNGEIVGDMNKREAVLGFLTGLYPQKGVDTFLMRQISRDERNNIQQVVTHAQLYFNRAQEAAANNNSKEYLINMKKWRAMIAPVVDSTNRYRIYQEAVQRARGGDNAFERAQRSMIWSTQDRDKKQKRLDQWEKEIQQEYGH